MAQRVSGYQRRENELYETPGWVAEALVPHLPRKPKSVLEPAPGSGRMVQALAGAFGPSVRIVPHPGSFLEDGHHMGPPFDAIITNPPYGAGGRLALQFIETALNMQEYYRGMVAMLLKVDFDSGATRAHVFEKCPAFAKQVSLRKRIMWFPSETGNGPSENHAWFIWDWKHSGPPTKAYAP